LVTAVATSKVAMVTSVTTMMVTTMWLHHVNYDKNQEGCCKCFNHSS